MESALQEDAADVPSANMPADGPHPADQTEPDTEKQEESGKTVARKPKKVSPKADKKQKKKKKKRGSSSSDSSSNSSSSSSGDPPSPKLPSSDDSDGGPAPACSSKATFEEANPKPRARKKPMEPPKEDTERAEVTKPPKARGSRGGRGGRGGRGRGEAKAKPKSQPVDEGKPKATSKRPQPIDTSALFDLIWLFCPNRLFVLVAVRFQALQMQVT